MKATGAQVISALRTELQSQVGRHLYAVLGTYEQLERFELDDLSQARGAGGNPLPVPVNLNASLLGHIADDDLRKLIQDEARYPLAARRRLDQQLRQVLTELLRQSNCLILKQLELMWAYALDWAIFRTSAANQHHLVLMLPGERRADAIVLFHECDGRFQRMLPPALVPDNHVWELSDG